MGISLGSSWVLGRLRAMLGGLFGNLGTPLGVLCGGFWGRVGTILEASWAVRDFGNHQKAKTRST
eukprot:6043932-Pyramimonas_sp.AAC.1